MHHYIIILQYNKIGVNIFINNISKIAKIYCSKCNYVDIRIKKFLKYLYLHLLNSSKQISIKKLLAI